MNDIAGMWICGDCNTLAVVSYGTDSIIVEQCACVKAGNK